MRPGRHQGWIWLAAIFLTLAGTTHGQTGKSPENAPRREIIKSFQLNPIGVVKHQGKQAYLEILPQ